MNGFGFLLFLFQSIHAHASETTSHDKTLVSQSQQKKNTGFHVPRLAVGIQFGFGSKAPTSL